MTLFHYDPRAARPTAPRGDHQTEALVAHVERHIAPVETVYVEIISETVHVDVLITAAVPHLPYRLALTSGLSDLPMRVPQGAQHLAHAEILALLPREWPIDERSFADPRWFWPIATLRRLARLPHEHGSYFAFGHTLGNGEPPAPYHPSTQLAGAVLLQAPNLPRELHTVSIQGHTGPRTVHLLSFVPLYAEEIALARASGLDALTSRLVALGIDGVLRVDRPNAAAPSLAVSRQGGQVSTSAFVSAAPSGIGMTEAAQLQSMAQGALGPNDRASAVNAAARLLVGGQYEAAIAAYKAIGEADPSRRGLAAGQIGAACFFLGRYEEAITWYRTSAEWGEEAAMVRDNIEEAEAELRKRGRPVPSAFPSAGPPPASAAPMPQGPSLPPGALRDTIRNMALSAKGRRLHFAEDLPANKAAHAREILGPHAAEPVVAFFDLTLMGGGRDAVVLTDQTLVARDGGERVVVPLAAVASPLLVGTLEDRVQVVANGATLTFPVGNHGETLVRVLSAIAMVVHRARMG
ncbi:MAG: suppressor of fused domain protein [Sandaracinaceae bacterium]|nr:suppressor of fused domain protein [Sandaracinaceae bacterium]